MNKFPWLEREALITVKAYPNPSSKYFETVCVAGVTREEGWIRLYPVQFRSLPERQRFRKYQRVRLRMRKHETDPRPESYRPDEQTIGLLDVVGTKNGWRERWQWIRPTVGPSMCGLLKEEAFEQRSLGCIKVRSAEKFSVEAVDSEWTGRKKSAVDQLALFDPVESKLEKIPFVFRYHYRCAASDCRGHRQSILDWELMELYRKCRDKGLDSGQIIAQVEKKFFGELCGHDKDTHFFVGNHSAYPNTFMVLGVFWPPRSPEGTLF